MKNKETFEEATIPLMKWLIDNEYYASKVIVTADSAELLVGQQFYAKTLENK